MRSDPALVTFIEDMPHLEAAARGRSHFVMHKDYHAHRQFLVSVQIINQSVNALGAGLAQVQDEIKELQNHHALPPRDRFLHVMQVFSDVLNSLMTFPR